MKFLNVILFLFLCQFSFAQGNLQFGQAILTEFTANNLGNGGSVICSPSTITVPAGKVWKIEQSTVYISFSQGS